VCRGCGANSVATIVRESTKFRREASIMVLDHGDSPKSPSYRLCPLGLPNETMAERGPNRRMVPDLSVMENRQVSRTQGTLLKSTAHKASGHCRTTSHGATPIDRVGECQQICGRAGGF
jgi:hypothetical protein